MNKKKVLGGMVQVTRLGESRVLREKTERERVMARVNDELLTFPKA